MNFTLHEYQKAFRHNIACAVRDHHRTIACAATGSGKTKTFISIAHGALGRGKTVLILSETISIFTQITAEIKATHIADGCQFTRLFPGQVYVAMAQTLVRRPHLLQQFADMGADLLVIVDEAHIGTHTKCVAALPNAQAIGFTATPAYKHAKHLPQLYRNIVVGPQPLELVEKGYLCPYKHFERRRADIARLQLATTGEYTEASQEDVFNDRIVYDGLIEDLGSFQFRKCIIFTASIKDCGLTYSALTGAGFHCVEVHTKAPAANLKQFTHGLIPICVSVGQLTKGWDYRPTDLVVLKLKTTSLCKYLQMIGRASRTSPNKTHFTVLDYGMNLTQHLPWNYEHSWAEMWNAIPKKKKTGVRPIKTCPQCDYMLPATARTCDNCGYIYPTPAPELPPESVLVEATAEYTRLSGRQISTLNPDELAVYARLTNKKQFAIRIAKHHAQTRPDFLFQFGRRMQYKEAWVHYQLNQLPQEPILFTDITIR